MPFFRQRPAYLLSITAAKNFWQTHSLGDNVPRLGLAWHGRRSPFGDLLIPQCVPRNAGIADRAVNKKYGRG